MADSTRKMPSHISGATYIGSEKKKPINNYLIIIEATLQNFFRHSRAVASYLKHIEGEPESVEFLRVRNSVDLYAAGLIEIFVMTGRS